MSGNTSSITAGQDINFSSQGNWLSTVKGGISLFTYGKATKQDKPNQETGIKLHAASGKVSVQAQSDVVKMTADKAITVASVSKSVNIAAKEHVMLTAQGAYLKLEGRNIMIHGPGVMEFKASIKELAGPRRSNPIGTVPSPAPAKPSAAPAPAHVPAAKPAPPAPALKPAPLPAKVAAAAAKVSVEQQRTDKKHPVTVLSSPTLTPSGAAWCNRFLGSNSLDSLNAEFKPKAKAFISALKAQGITVKVSAAYRPVERSYLMYNAFQIPRGMDATKAKTWPGVPIDWAHRSADGTPDPVAAKRAAEAMCAGYGIHPHSAQQKVGKPAFSKHNKRAAIDMNVSGYVGKTVKNKQATTSS